MPNRLLAGVRQSHEFLMPEVSQIGMSTIFCCCELYLFHEFVTGFVQVLFLTLMFLNHSQSIDSRIVLSGVGRCHDNIVVNFNCRGILIEVWNSISGINNRWITVNHLMHKASDKVCWLPSSSPCSLTIPVDSQPCSWNFVYVVICILLPKQYRVQSHFFSHIHWYIIHDRIS